MPVLPFPPDLTPAHILNKHHADAHGVLWRQPEILPPPPPPPLPTDPAAGANGAPPDPSLLPGMVPASEVGGGPMLGTLPLETPALLDGLPVAPVGSLPPHLADLMTAPPPPGSLPAIPMLLPPLGGLPDELLAQLNNVSTLQGGYGVVGEEDDGGGSGAAGGGGGGGGGGGRSSRHANGRSGGGGGARAAAGGRSAANRGYCQVEGCNTELATLRDYHQRYKVRYRAALWACCAHAARGEARLPGWRLLAGGALLSMPRGPLACL